MPLRDSDFTVNTTNNEALFCKFLNTEIEDEDKWSNDSSNIF